MKAALYVRVSTANQVERYSLPAQRRLLVEHCERQTPPWGHTIYEDAGISGETIADRPAMQRLLQDALARKVDVVLVVEMERLSRARDGVDLALIKRTFRSAGVRFGTPAQLFDPEDVEDDFVSGLLGLLASREKQKIVERTSRGRIEAARQGRYVAGRVPFGYRRDGGILKTHEPEAEIVRRVFQLLAQGQSTYAIARALNADRVPTATVGKKWTRQTVLKLLRNSAYAGRAYFGRQRVLSREGRHRRLEWRDASQWIGVPVPRIIPEEIFRSVEARVQQNIRLSQRRQKRFYLLRSLVRCAVCGKTMVGKFSGGYRYYTCWGPRDAGLAPRCRWHAASADRLERLVWEQVTLALQRPELVLAQARRYRESRFGMRDELLARLEYVRKALLDLPKERERVQTLYREGYASIEEVKVQLAESDRRRAALEDEGQGLETRLTTSTADEAQQVRLEDVLARLGQRLAALADQERFELVHAFVSRVLVAKSGIVEIQAYVPAAGAPDPSYVRTAWRRPPTGEDSPLRQRSGQVAPGQLLLGQALLEPRDPNLLAERHSAPPGASMK